MVSWSIDRAVSLREDGFGWTDISRILGVSGTDPARWVMEAIRRRRLGEFANIVEDWDTMFFDGRIQIRRTKKNKRGKVEKPRRQIQYLDKTYIFARVVWNCMHPNDIAQPYEDVHHKDEDTLNDCPENLEKLDLHVHRSFPKGPQHGIKIAEGHKDFWDAVRRGEKEHYRGYAWDVNKALELNEQGKDFHEIANLLGVTGSVVRNYFAKMGIEYVGKRYKEKWDVEEAKRLREEGESWKKIAKTMGIPNGQIIRSYFIYHGLPLGRTKARIIEKKEKRAIKTLTCFNKTQTYEQWANETKICVSTLRERIRVGWSIERALTEPVIARVEWGLIEFCDEERTLKEWSGVLGMNYETLRKRIQKEGWDVVKAFTTPVGASKFYGWEPTEKIWHLIESGSNMREIVRQTGAPYQKIKELFVERGLLSQRRTWDIEKAKQLREEGRTWKEIAKVVGASTHSTIRNYFVSNGISFRKSKRAYYKKGSTMDWTKTQMNKLNLEEVGIDNNQLGWLLRKVTRYIKNGGGGLGKLAEELGMERSILQDADGLSFISAVCEAQHSKKAE